VRPRGLRLCLSRRDERAASFVGATVQARVSGFGFRVSGSGFEFRVGVSSFGFGFRVPNRISGPGSQSPPAWAPIGGALRLGGCPGRGARGDECARVGYGCAFPEGTSGRLPSSAPPSRLRVSGFGFRVSGLAERRDGRTWTCTCTPRLRLQRTAGPGASYRQVLRPRENPPHDPDPALSGSPDRRLCARQRTNRIQSLIEGSAGLRQNDGTRFGSRHRRAQAESSILPARSQLCACG